jgi:hypothetical protein
VALLWRGWFGAILLQPQDSLGSFRNFAEYIKPFLFIRRHTRSVGQCPSPGGSEAAVETCMLSIAERLFLPTVREGGNFGNGIAETGEHRVASSPG